jgi:hypothetical protein
MLFFQRILLSDDVQSERMRDKSLGNEVFSPDAIGRDSE